MGTGGTDRRKAGAALLLAAGIAVLTACGADNTERDTYRQFGINCLENGKFPEAVDAFQNALNQSVGHVGETEIDICFYKARAQYLNGDTDAALETYDAIIEYNEDARAYYLRGNLYFALGQQEKALEDYSRAIEKDGKNYEIYIGIYETMSENGLAEQGREYLKQGQALKGEQTADCLGKGRICYLLGDYEQAVQYLDKALEKEEYAAAYYLGLTYKALGDAANAGKYIQQYLDSGIATSYDLYELGTREMSQGDYAQALVYYNTGLAMASVPNRQNLMRGAVAAYEYSGDFASAKSMLLDYLKLYPSDEEAQRESVFLKTR